MKKIYTLQKDIEFKNNIYEIIDLEIDKELMMEEFAIKGVFKIKGSYYIKEDYMDSFDIEVPYLNYIEDDYDVSNVSLDIEDFYYEIKDSNILSITINILVDNINIKEVLEDVVVDEVIPKEESRAILNDNNFVTYKIIIVRDNDTIESICEKYNTNIDVLREYNVINDIKVGDKLIIPYE